MFFSVKVWAFVCLVCTHPQSGSLSSNMWRPRDSCRVGGRRGLGRSERKQVEEAQRELSFLFFTSPLKSPNGGKLSSCPATGSVWRHILMFTLTNQNWNPMPAFLIESHSGKEAYLVAFSHWKVKQLIEVPFRILSCLFLTSFNSRESLCLRSLLGFTHAGSDDGDGSVSGPAVWLMLFPHRKSIVSFQSTAVSFPWSTLLYITSSSCFFYCLTPLCTVYLCELNQQECA